MTIEQLAEVVHGIQTSYCANIGEQLPSWGNAPQHMKQSTIDGVKFHLNDPFAGASGSHNNWMAEKIRQGWKYGPVRDAVKKEHPSLVPFEQLSKEEQIKDVIFSSTVHNLVPFID